MQTPTILLLTYHCPFVHTKSQTIIFSPNALSPLGNSYFPFSSTQPNPHTEKSKTKITTFTLQLITMVPFLLLAFLLSMINHSSATYCVCNQGVNETVLQKNIDYACGAGADCSAILVSGSCYQPNTVKAHCDYAVNYYYQKMNQVTGSCSFSGTATVTPTLRTTLVSGCTYPASPSGISSSTPTSSPVTPTSSTSTTTSPTTSTTGSTSFPIAPTGFVSRGCTIRVELISVTLITLFLTGFLALWC